MRVRKQNLFGPYFAIVVFLVPVLATDPINASSQINYGTRSTVPELVPTTVIKASFGASNAAFGFDDLRDNGGRRINLVPCFAIGEQGIFLFDGIKSDIKVYSHGGTHLRTVRVRRSSGSRELNVRATDMAVAAGKIYVLTDLGGKSKDPDRTRFRVLVFDAFSGEQLEELMIPDDELGTILEKISGEEIRLQVSGSVTIERFGDDFIVYDHDQQFGFPLVREGKSLEPAQRASVTGQGLADRRLRQDKQRSTIQLLSQETASDLMWGALYTVSRDSRFFLPSRMTRAPPGGEQVCGPLKAMRSVIFGHQLETGTSSSAPRHT